MEYAQRTTTSPSPDEENQDIKNIRNYFRLKNVGKLAERYIHLRNSVKPDDQLPQLDSNIEMFKPNPNGTGTFTVNNKKKIKLMRNHSTLESPRKMFIKSPSNTIETVYKAIKNEPETKKK